jgi:uncharacterized Zn finger protein
MVETTLQINRSRNRWWSEQWLTLLYEIDPTYAPSAGRSRGGSRRSRVQRLSVQPGLIQGQVRDRESGPCTVVIETDQLHHEQWQAVIDGLAGQAIFAAQLLAGDLPVEIEEVFARAGVSLLPAGRDDLHVLCHCCGVAEQPTEADGGDPIPVCAHVEAVFQQMSNMLADDPWLLFQLRGRERPQILQALRERRLSNQSQERTLPSPQNIADPENHAFFRLHPDPDNLSWSDRRVHPLDADLEGFWGDAKLLESLQHRLARPEIELTLLRRLGYPPFSSQSMESYDALAQIYRQVTDEALKLAFGDDSEGDGEGDGEDDGEDDGEVEPGEDPRHEAGLGPGLDSGLEDRPGKRGGYDG